MFRLLYSCRLVQLGVKVSVVLISLCAAPVLAQLPAFPGAEGFGKYAVGGRGGSVYFVTNLNDSGPGSFRDAVSVSGRTVIFKVGGVIAYTGSRYAPKPNITIAGQTAPGDGVTIYGNGLSFSGSHNNIVRFFRVREGVNGDSGTDAMGIANGHDMIFDHITSSWGRDETFSINGDVTNITIQSAIISQGLQGHSAGGLIQTSGGVSILRSLYIDNDTRNPKVKGVNEFVNNVVCNWETIGYNMGGDSAGESWCNVFDNYFMRGQASSTTAIGGGNTDFHIYATNNWYDGNHNGILDGSDLPFASYGSMDLQTVPFSYPIDPATAYSPLTALKLAISDAGPSFRRDSVDQLMMTQLTSWGILGGTITSELVPPMNGPGVIRNGTPYPDADNDGMPDFWEIGTGSDPNTANNNDPSPSGSGYTRLEDYLNWLAKPHGIALQNTNVVVDLRQFTRGWVVINHSPFWSAGNATNGTVTLSKGYMAAFTPTLGLNGPASFQFIVNDADGSPVTNTMNLFFTPSAQSYTPVWHGDDLTNNWDVLGDYNWHDGISLLYQFHQGDAVLFDDTGSTAPPVNLVGSVQPASVTVGATKNYIFSGSGSLDGSMALVKTNTGTLIIDTTNGYTGNTTVSNGVLFVDGTLTASAVTARSGSTVGGNGQLGNSLTALSGSTITPGDGIDSPGTLTVSNGLTISGGVTNRFDLSDDPTGMVKTNDVINVTGDLNLSGVNVLKFSFLDGLPGNGVYTLITYSGNLNGSLANFSLAGINGTLTNPPGAIAIIVSATRPPATIEWTGNGTNNIWDNGTNVCWNNDGAVDRFYFGDDVIFDDTGSSNLTANLVGALTPDSVTVDATVNYTLTGAGFITGSTGLTVTNTGTLTVLTANDFTGPTVIGGGELSVSRIANSGAASSIGAASSDPGNLVFFDSGLSYTGGSTASDRGATFNGNADFEITGGGTTVTWNGTNTGVGSLTTTGSGTLTLTANNSYAGGTVVSNGTLALFGPSGGATITANNYALGSGSVTLYGGTLKLFGGGLGDAAAGYGTFSRPLIVPAGATAALLTPARYTMSSSLSGAGTLNLQVNYVRGTLSGNWSAFTGLINVTAQTSPAEFRVGTTAGYAGSTIFLNNNVIMDRSGSATTIQIGALNGTSGAIVGPGNQSSSGSSYSIGWNNQDATFAGQLQADGANTFTKVGTGNWTLTGANSYSGGTVVSNGTLTVDNTSGSGTGSASVNVYSGATLAGTGTISGATTINSGATASPGDNGIGTLTINNAVTLAAGSTSFIEINKTSGAKDLLSASGALTYGGTLIVTNLSGALTNGDSFKIFGGGSYAGAFTTMSLPPLTPDLMWYTGTLITSGTISVVSTNFNAPQSITWTGDGSANVWDTSALNWLGTNGLQRAFSPGDTVTFDNTGSAAPPINVTVNVSPAAMNVNASQNYTLTGTGALAGTMSLTKSGTGKFTIANTGSNSFAGVVTISAGTLQVGDGVSVNGNIPGNIANSGTLIYANPTAATVSSLISGTGTLVKNSAGLLTIITSNSAFSGNVLIADGTVALTAGAALNTGGLTLSNGGTFNFPPSSPAYSYPGSITVPAGQSGTVFSPGLGNTVSGNLISGDTNSVLYLSSGVSLGGTSGSQLNGFTGTINVLPGATLRFSANSSGNTYGSLVPYFVANGSIRPRNAGNTVRLKGISGSGSLDGPQSNGGSGATTFLIGTNLDSVFNGVITSNTAVPGSTVVLNKVGTGALTLTGASTYTGGTTVNAGSLIVNNVTGSGTGSGGVAVASGATLGGAGFIGGSTTVSNGATLAPGNPTGTLTFAGNLALNSNSVLKFELGTSSDRVSVNGALSLAGQLQATNVSGFGPGVYTLFSSATPITFGTLTLASTPAGFNYKLDTNTTGVVKLVVSPLNPPVIGSTGVNGGAFVFSGTGGTPGLPYYVDSSTNLATPATNWIRTMTNQFDSSGNFSVTNGPATNVQNFYRVEVP
jgi:autotransporter-associated beta strand protein